jgi:hypothetical protein
MPRLLQPAWILNPDIRFHALFCVPALEKHQQPKQQNEFPNGFLTAIQKGVDLFHPCPGATSQESL